MPSISPNRRVPTRTMSTMFHSGLCDQPQPFSFRVVAHCAWRVKVHGCPLFRSVRGPMRQAVVIRIAGSGKIHPSSTDLLRENECLGSASTVMVANFSIVEGERDFTGVERTGAIVQHGRPPGIYVRVGRRAAQNSLPESLLEGRTPKGRG